MIAFIEQKDSLWQYLILSSFSECDGTTFYLATPLVMSVSRILWWQNIDSNHNNLPNAFLSNISQQLHGKSSLLPL